MSTDRRPGNDPFQADPPRPAVPGPATFDEGMSGGPNQPVAPKPASGNGRCLLWGCLLTVVFSLFLLVGGGFAAYWFYNAQLQKFTDEQPAEIPIVEASEEEVEAILGRIEAFQSTLAPDESDSTTTPDDGVDAADAVASDAVADGAVTPDAAPAPPTRELVLTADEINALIANEDQLRGRVFVEINDGELFGKISIPTDALPGGKGRFFNADGRFDVSMENGVLVVRLVGASVNGEDIPPTVMEGFANENLAKDFYKDPKNAEMLRRFESIEVVDDSIRLTLREPEPQPATESAEAPVDADLMPAEAGD